MEALLKTRTLSTFIFTITTLILLDSCSSSSAEGVAAAPPPPELPVLAVKSKPVTTYSEFNSAIEGKRDIEIRPKVDGYLEAIHVDEGSFVKRGQVLFRIDPRQYNAQLNTALAQLASAKAALESASINVSKLSPLVKNGVVSDVQLRTANAAYNMAKANVLQAQAQVQAAKINLSYTTITAPAAGYIGSIPFKTGSLVTSAGPEALTVLSETKEVHAYFSMSEVDFIDFGKGLQGGSLAEKIKSLPQIELVLPDETIYPIKGRVELVEGQFGKTTGTINFRASFPNPEGLLRSGSTGKVRIPKVQANTILVPQEATFELQDKVFVYTVNDSSKVVGKPLSIAGSNGKFYLVSKGLAEGEKIVFSGIDRLQEGAVIKPKAVNSEDIYKELK
ncbi:efflux RND transporter periplasmic adaptor subunit [Desertivirga brevis]|uniref:efflux RND transporter periplasmic adaptor subunit n=1 Tax=Desertivirga brevis TaxID=2810310 RepID=UPI001A961E73|nr:efflux RND transporter periplasmic adaptor subunit [Pedobacter sp. SYSU D00873]